MLKIAKKICIISLLHVHVSLLGERCGHLFELHVTNSLSPLQGTGIAVLKKTISKVAFII